MMDSIAILAQAANQDVADHSAARTTISAFHQYMIIARLTKFPMVSLETLGRAMD